MSKQPINLSLPTDVVEQVRAKIVNKLKLSALVEKLLRDYLKKGK